MTGPQPCNTCVSSRETGIHSHHPSPHPHRPEAKPATLHHWPSPSRLFLTHLGLWPRAPPSL